MNKVEKAILVTIAFFDIIFRPLTLEEIWEFLCREEASKLEVLLGLQKLEKNKKIIKIDTCYCLKGSENIVKDFLSKRALRQSRWVKVSWVGKILQLAPFVKNISVINSLSLGTSTKDSDIDILIIAKKGRLWTARAFLVLFLEILGQNKNKWYKAGKFCLGFAFDETRLDLQKIKFSQDIDFTYFLGNLTPIFDRGVYQKLIEENSWLKKELPNWKEDDTRYAKCDMRDAKLGTLEKILLGHFGDRLENWLAKIQIKKIWKDPINKRKGASVIADSSMMKLHAYDKRVERQKTLDASIKSLSVNPERSRRG